MRTMTHWQTIGAFFNRHRIAFAFAVILLAPSFAAAQQRFRTPQGIVEVVGLRRWTVQMIQDSAAKYAPGQDLASHACAAVLRLKLKFADASVVFYRTDTVYYRTDTVYYRSDTVYYRSDTASSGGVLIVSVIEPQDSALVRYKPRYHDSLPVRPEWRTAVDVFENHNHAFQTAVQSAT